MDSIKVPKTPKIYNCITCEFKTKHKGDYNKHLLTPKHINIIEYGSKPIKIHNCECGKKYKDRQNLYRHKKGCNFDSTIETLKIDISYRSNINYNIFELQWNNEILVPEKMFLKDIEIRGEKLPMNQFNINNLIFMIPIRRTISISIL
jgi:acetone carboxylase gamma subunit